MKNKLTLKKIKLSKQKNKKLKLSKKGGAPNNNSGMNAVGMNTAGMNTTDMDLAGMNTADMNLAGMNTAGMNLEGMNTAGMNLEGMNTADMNESSKNFETNDILFEKFIKDKNFKQKVYKDEELLFEPNYFDKLKLSSQIKSYLNQGYYPLGINITAFIKENIGDNTNKNASDLENEVSNKKTFDKIGEYVDEDYNTIIKTITGERDKLLQKSLFPEKVLSDQSTFGEIINESRKYTQDDNEVKITPKGLFKMCKMLNKYGNENQWYRVASLLEVMYKYLNEGLSKSEFFGTSFNINKQVLNEVEELWKTEHLFITEQESNKLKEKLKFYK
jgi:hypothetical protein